ncbi:MAG: SUMF1/EgtB/PvdO family nonheme iron enzyme [Candidatus Latescibacteria bacterium]|nr:SUMF1/EgtB/PvdO family nonheme iron enzyme [Candidatus Latescibacterota bacterium]
MYRLLLVAVFVLCLLVLFGCERENSVKESSLSVPLAAESGETGFISLKVSFKPLPGRVAKTAAIEAINKVTAYLYTPHLPMHPVIELAKKDLTFIGGRAQGSIEVAAQENLRLVLVCYHGETVRYIGEDNDIDVYVGQETQALIFVEFIGIILIAPSTVLSGNSYTMECQTNSYTLEYELWESRSPSFDDAKLIDSQSDPLFSVTAKDSAGNYYYRARSMTVYGPGPWIDEGMTAVCIDNGSILIDFISPENYTGITFVSIPGGTFQMGDETGDLTLECRPVHTVTLSGYEMSACEITNAQYAQYLNDALATGDITISNTSVKGVKGEYSGQEYIYLTTINNGDFPYSRCWITYENDTFNVENGYEYWPVAWVSWYGAKAFALYYGMDLPTEAEWEYACRGGKQYKYGTDDGTISPDKANYIEGGFTNFRHSIDVGSYPANPYGLHDMSGNVYEWCNDLFGNYTSVSATNPTGAETSDKHIIRGGSSVRSYDYCMSANRNSFYTNGESFDVGFRIVRRPGGVTY